MSSTVYKIKDSVDLFLNENSHNNSLLYEYKKKKII